MERSMPVYYEDLDLKISVGNLDINVLYINYEAAKPGWSFDSHTHSSYELHFIPAGLGKLWVDDREYDIVPGTFYLTGPGVVHAQKADLSDPMSEYCMNFELRVSRRKKKKSSPYLEPEVAEIWSTLSSTHFWFGRDAFDSIDLFAKIEAELSNRVVGYFAYVQSLTIQIILNAIRSFSEAKQAPYAPPKKILNDSRRKLVDNYFREYNRPLNPAELADLIGTSVRQLNRILKQYYGMTFKEKWTGIRLEQSKKLLQETGLPIGEIAERSGFSHYNHYCRLFHAAFAISPGRYRELHRPGTHPPS